MSKTRFHRVAMFVGSMFAAANWSMPLAAQGRQNDTTTLAELYRSAWDESPRLAAAREYARAVAARVPAAGLPPDPMVELGAMNLSLPGLSADMPTSMVPSVQLMQMLPLGKLGPARDIARHATAIAEAEALEAWWEVRADVAMAYHEIYAVDARLDVMRETLALLDDMRAVAQSMYASGMGNQSDVLRAAVERARMEADIRRMEAMRTAENARLNAILGRVADAPVVTPSVPVFPVAMPPIETLREWAEQSRPMLEASRAAVRQARSAVQLARRELWPDITVGVGYGQRPGDMDMGTERMGSLMLGFSVPIFARSRQLRMRDEMEAMERMAEADLAMERALVDARIAELVANLEQTEGLVALYRDEILPQADANVSSAFSSYRAGSVDFMTLVDARMSANDHEQELHTLLADYGLTIAELEMTIGRELSNDSGTDSEIR